MPPSKALRIAALVSSTYLLATASIAETTYREFYDMDENRQWDIFDDTITTLLETRGKDDAVGFCLAEAFSNEGIDTFMNGLPRGNAMVYAVVEFERGRKESYGHDRTVEQLIIEVAELLCPPSR